MYILGINAAFHDSAACLLNNGQLIAAAEEERFTGIKHAKRPIPFSSYELPFHAIDYCLRVAGIHISEVDHIAYSFNPRLFDAPTKGNSAEIPIDSSKVASQSNGNSVWDPLFLSLVSNAPRHLAGGYPHHLQESFAGAGDQSQKWHFVDHHIAHAASAYLASPYDSAAILTIDGRGESTTTSYYLGKGNELTKIKDIHVPHSLGLLYEKITTHLGFLHSSDEYKVMALASYGQPEFVDQFRSVIHVHGDGTYTIDEFDPELLLGPKRKRNDPFTEHHFNIAHSLQHVLQETVLQLVDWLYEKTGEKNLCMAGGVALNCVLNGLIRQHGRFENVWVQPAAGDSGTALGAALYIRALTEPHKKHFVMDHCYWGPGYSDEEVEKFLQWAKIPFKKLQNVAEETAEVLAQNKIIGWFQGRMEYGPRALGSRSILASPIEPEMQQKLNDIKDREDFRPVAPAVLEKDAPHWFKDAGYSPFMLFVYPVREEVADKIPAVRHVDGTARIQTVNQQQNRPYFELLSAFKKKTGVPVLINTSFNTRGKPIVCTPADAIESFFTTRLDALVINRFLIQKEQAC